MTMTETIDRRAIEATYEVIRPHVRVTPVVHVDAADFGRAPQSLTLELESMQHAGSFKTRGAFANLLLRTIPPEGVVAASGGNHGAAVAYAAMRRGVRARIFVEEVRELEERLLHVRFAHEEPRRVCDPDQKRAPPSASSSARRITTTPVYDPPLREASGHQSTVGRSRRPSRAAPYVTAGIKQTPEKLVAAIDMLGFKASVVSVAEAPTGETPPRR